MSAFCGAALAKFYAGVEAALPKRPPLVPRRLIRQVPRTGDPPSQASGSLSFSILQFNTMADTFSSVENYSRVEAGAAAWEYRKWRLLEEIMRWDADVVALQEVDHFWDWFEPQMEAFGYAAAYLGKPARKDGSATFVKRSKFELATVEGLSYVDGETVEHQVALATVLRSREVTPDGGTKAREVLVVNTHLRAIKNESGEQVRTRQVGQLTDWVLAMRQAYREGHGADLSTVVCGDFNARPNDAATYPATAVPLMLRRGFSSAYDLHDPEVYTTWKWRPDKASGGEVETKHCIDYIFYCTAHQDRPLTTLELLSLPTTDEVGSPDGLPAYNYPSDHLAIMARVLLP